MDATLARQRADVCTSEASLVDYRAVVSVCDYGKVAVHEDSAPKDERRPVTEPDPNPGVRLDTSLVNKVKRTGAEGGYDPNKSDSGDGFVVAQVVGNANNKV